jgi:hypothetical protein
MNNLDLTVLLEFGKFNHIVYYDEPHKYYIDGKQQVSCTTFIGMFKPKFETDKIATNFSEKHDLNKSDVIEEWDYKRDSANMKGTIFHKYAEDRLANKIFPYTHKQTVEKLYGHDIIKPKLDICFSHFDKFYEDSKYNLIPVKSEWIVGDKEIGISGCVDQIFYNKKSGKLEVWDWKTNRKIETSSQYKNKMKHPISHLDICEINTYSLQLSMYKYIIESNTNLKFGDSYIVWFNEANESYKLFKCFDFTDECKDMIKYAKNAKWI